MAVQASANKDTKKAADKAKAIQAVVDQNIAANRKASAAEADGASGRRLEAIALAPSLLIVVRLPWVCSHSDRLIVAEVIQAQLAQRKPSHE